MSCNTSRSTLTVAATSPPLRTAAGYSRRVETPRPPLVIAELSTARLTLRPLDPTLDATDLFEMDADPLVHQYVYGSSPSHSIEQLQRRLAAELERNGGMTWAIRLREEPTVLGTIGIFADQGSTIRGLSWSLRRSHWGQGLTSEAASAIVPFLLAQPGVDGLEAWADSRNIGSLKVADSSRLGRTGPVATVIRRPRRADRGDGGRCRPGRSDGVHRHHRTGGTRRRADGAAVVRRARDAHCLDAR